MNTHKLVKGQLLYREKYRRHLAPAEEREIESLEVATVGTKYFTVREDPHTRFLRATLQDEYRHRPALRLGAQEIRDEWERSELQRELRRVFEYSRVPLEALRQIVTLVPEQLADIRKLLRSIS